MQITFSRKAFGAILSLAFGNVFLHGRSEHALLRDAKNRDRESFSELMRLHTPTLRRFIARRVNESEREDILQDTWLAAWEALPSFDHGSRLRTWLHSICFHKIQDYWRREQKRPPSTQIFDEEGRTVYFPKEYDAVELRETLSDFWQSCTPDQREMLRMYYADGLTLKEISAVLERNLNTVKYQFYRIHDEAGRALGPMAESHFGGRKS
jgi:RNA polymerase sigma-70 factor (ECF subfamily)